MIKNNVFKKLMGVIVHFNNSSPWRPRKEDHQSEASLKSCLKKKFQDLTCFSGLLG
jgi:hypothetical protein